MDIMKNQLSKYTILTLLICLLFGACKKQLNVYPTTSKVDGSVITDAKSAQDALNGLYFRFANSYYFDQSSTSTQWGDVHGRLPSELVGSFVNGFGDDGIYTLSYDDRNGDIIAVWTYGYKLLNAANGFLKNIAPLNDINPTVKSRMIAEAKFLRAFSKATLLLYFGDYDNVNSPNGIILRDDFVETSNINLPLSPVGQVYGSIIKDLNEAIPDLPSTASKKYYAPAAAAKILKARVLINRGGPGDYDAVISLMREVIAAGPYQLESNLKDLFLSKGFNSTEVILGVQPYATESNNFFLYQYGFFSGNPDFVNLLDGDPRADWLFKDDGFQYQITKYYDGDPYNVARTDLSVTSYAFRLTEAYLLQAEAICLKNKNTANANIENAKTLLKTVMEKAGITDFSKIDAINNAADLHKEVVKETIINFVGENGADFFALRRLSLNDIKVYQTNITSKDQLVFPIPFAEVNANPALRK
jgi:hypothetical protein